MHAQQSCEWWVKRRSQINTNVQLDTYIVTLWVKNIYIYEQYEGTSEMTATNNENWKEISLSIYGAISFRQMSQTVTYFWWPAVWLAGLCFEFEL